MAERIPKKGILEYIEGLQSYFGILYVTFVAIGMLFEYQRYQVYGINIFLFADIFDFLLAPLRDISVLLYILLSMTIIYILLKADEYLRQQRPAWYRKTTFGLDGKSWFPILHRLSYGALFIFYLYISSLSIAKKSKQMMLTSNNHYLIRTNDDKLVKAYILGRAKDDLILFDVSNKVTIMPLGSIRSMTK
ncbi:hypothetical protein LLH06_10950 [Mucilaginibacter daejeonensis]|uniref:hypothetical protein n=1 Tax=Mucilaginibacter daejeonensis TaxID=398049 RepID=UPI001D177500|nr:hypothetical protein [Mucilaginibacter daejeonensis]UEG51491.1 hypothetical protein LLH06_10950 [Mucilaginibacter daejeonensis]